MISNKVNLVFDVDGTITPSREKISTKHKEYILKLIKSGYNVFLVTGSDREKTIEQIGEDLYTSVNAVYNCSGGDVWIKDKNVMTTDWSLPSDARNFLEESLKLSKYPYRFGNHIEDRIGMVNFSVVGRNANKEQRYAYHNWDNITLERKTIAKLFNDKFPKLEARVAGEIGIDISFKGNDKSQIVKHFSKSDIFYFFGDKMDSDGNDYPLAKALCKFPYSVNVYVNNPDETFDFVRKKLDVLTN